MNQENTIKNDIWEALKEIQDPEMPIDIVNLGLIYAIHLKPNPNGTSWDATISMTLTNPACTLGPFIAQQIKQTAESISGVDRAFIEIVWDPPWTKHKISEEGRMMLGIL